MVRGNHVQFIPEQIVGGGDYFRFYRCRMLLALRGGDR
jgi:hypothetical protein